MNYRINPKIRFSESEYYLRNSSLKPTVIENDTVYSMVKKLTEKFYPTSKDKHDTCWSGFYLPLKRRGKEISIPFSVVKYEGNYYCNFFRLGDLCVKKGDKQFEGIYVKVFSEAVRFTGKIKKTKGAIVEKIPFIAQDYEGILDYLAGETYFAVNEYSDNYFFYIPSLEYKKKYFKHIEWDGLRIPRHI